MQPISTRQLTRLCRAAALISIAPKNFLAMLTFDVSRMLPRTGCLRVCSSSFRSAEPWLLEKQLGPHCLHTHAHSSQALLLPEAGVLISLQKPNDNAAETMLWKPRMSKHVQALPQKATKHPYRSQIASGEPPFFCLAPPSPPPTSP